MSLKSVLFWYILSVHWVNVTILLDFSKVEIKWLMSSLVNPKSYSIWNIKCKNSWFCQKISVRPKVGIWLSAETETFGEKCRISAETFGRNSVAKNSCKATKNLHSHVENWKYMWKYQCSVAICSFQRFLHFSTISKNILEKILLSKIVKYRVFSSNISRFWFKTFGRKIWCHRISVSAEVSAEASAEGFGFFRFRSYTS